MKYKVYLQKDISYQMTAEVEAVNKVEARKIATEMATVGDLRGEWYPTDHNPVVYRCHETEEIK